MLKKELLTGSSKSSFSQDDLVSVKTLWMWLSISHTYGNNLSNKFAIPGRKIMYNQKISNTQQSEKNHNKN